MDLGIHAQDRPNLLRDLSEVFARLRLRLVRVTTHSRRSLAHMVFTVEVRDGEPDPPGPRQRTARDPGRAAMSTPRPAQGEFPPRAAASGKGAAIPRRAGPSANSPLGDGARQGLAKILVCPVRPSEAPGAPLMRDWT